jgi:hypothetical protein
MKKQLDAWLADTQATATPQPGSWTETTITGKEASDAFNRFREARQESYPQNK